MASLWPWLAIAGLGALHGLSPANGWMFAAAWGVRARDAAQARRALWSIAIGHGVSVAVVAAVFALGMWVDTSRAQGAAGALLVGVASRHGEVDGSRVAGLMAIKGWLAESTGTGPETRLH